MSNTSTGERVACDPGPGWLVGKCGMQRQTCLLMNWHECKWCLNINSKLSIRCMYSVGM